MTAAAVTAIPQSRAAASQATPDVVDPAAVSPAQVEVALGRFLELFGTTLPALTETERNVYVELGRGEELLAEEGAGVAERGGLYTVAVLFVSLDDFRGVNDAFGHGTGDAVLTEIGRRIRATVPAGATVVRLGADEFAVLATTDNAERNEVADRLAVSLPDDAPAGTYPVVVANILAGALEALADTLAARVAPGGRIALSGILAGQEGPLLERYAAWFDHLAVAREGDWLRIDGVRRAATLPGQ